MTRQHSVARSVIDDAADVLTVIGDHVGEIQDRRRLPDRVDHALRASGINRMLLPVGSSHPRGSKEPSL